MKIIQEIGGDETLNHRDNQNRTPLIVAAIGGHGEVVNYLLSQEGQYRGPWANYLISQEDQYIFTGD